MTECPMHINFLQDKPEGELSKNDRFLLPIVKWGPNNQILGFYEAMHLSNFLNAKLVLPPFFFHESDHNRNRDLDTVAGEIRINSEQIKNLVTLADYKKFCGKTAEAVLLATDVLSGSLPGRINYFQDVTGIEILENRKAKFQSQIKQYPNISEIQSRYKEGDNFVRDTWQLTFKKAIDEGNKCMIFVLPFRTILRPAHNLLSNKEAYQYSPIVAKIAQDFIQKSGQIDVGAHWRYNKGDWSHRCASHNTRPECKMMHKLNYQKVAENLCDISIKAARGKNIYIAAPLSEIGIINQVSTNATHNIKIFNSNNMISYAKSAYSGCKWFHDYTGEIISLVEQAILTQVKEFLPWPTSSWSSRIGDFRSKIGLRGSRYDLFKLFSESLRVFRPWKAKMSPQ